MKHKATTITFRGTRREVRLIGAVARAKGMEMGDLVRHALYSIYGKDIAKMARAFPEDAVITDRDATEDDAEEKEHDDLLTA